MKPARIYKTKLRQNILRQMLFTDRNILIVVTLGITLIVGFSLNFMAIEHRIIISIAVIGILLTVASTKIDNQPVFTLLPRAIKYLFKNKRKRY